MKQNKRIPILADAGKMVSYVRLDAMRLIQKNTPPLCFHCGASYRMDSKHSDDNHSTWMPDCLCITGGVRIVTGGELLIEEVEE